ncbi:MAG: peptidyl-prolyl cis-trans isomerase [Candidatus Omnitrophica bacterium]|nr:peptidyl-prolyl cis-trans isomerase [Candidatus Omnitrophota bacterium]
MIFKNLRKYMKTIMWLIAIFIVPAFVIWNIGSAVSNRRSGYAGEIFNKKVALKDFTIEKQAARNDAWMQYGDNFAQSVDLEEQTWTRLILLIEAKKNNISVSNKELLDYIKSLPLFQYAQMSPQNYAMIISRLFQQSTVDFERGIQHSLLIAKLMQEVTDKISAGDEEIREAYIKDKEQASASYILVNPAELLDAVAADNVEDIKAYYENNKEQFKKPERVSVEYIEIKFEHFKDSAKISDERLQDYYEKNKTQFKIPEAEGAEGRNSAPQYKEFAEVKNGIHDKLLEKEMNNLASETARQIMNNLYTERTFSEVAAEFGLTAKKTAPFSMLEEIPEVGLSFPFLKAAFSLKTGEISEIIKTPTALYILKPIKKFEPYVPEFEEVKDAAKEKYRSVQAESLARNKAEELRSEIISLMEKDNLTFKDAAEKTGRRIKTVTDLTRSGYVNELGFAQEFTNAVFSLKPQEVSSVISTPRGFCIAQLEKITPVDEEKFKTEKEQYREKILVFKKNRFLNVWFSKIKEEANPKIYPQNI